MGNCLVEKLAGDRRSQWQMENGKIQQWILGLDSVWKRNGEVLFSHSFVHSFSIPDSIFDLQSSSSSIFIFPSPSPRPGGIDCLLVLLPNVIDYSYSSVSFLLLVSIHT